jgi:hypothetical protein
MYRASQDDRPSRQRRGRRRREPTPPEEEAVEDEVPATLEAKAQADEGRRSPSRRTSRWPRQMRVQLPQGRPRPTCEVPPASRRDRYTSPTPSDPPRWTKVHVLTTRLYDMFKIEIETNNLFESLVQALGVCGGSRPQTQRHPGSPMPRALPPHSTVCREDRAGLHL